MPDQPITNLPEAAPPQGDEVVLVTQYGNSRRTTSKDIGKLVAHVGTTPPSDPEIGDLWVDTN